MTDTEWIKPGARVVVFREGSRGNYNLVVTTINKVATKSFTVHNVEPRFRLNSQRTAIQGGSWGWTWRCVPYDSEYAQQILAQRERHVLERKAWDACEAWIKDRTEKNRVAAIAALTKLEKP